MKIEDKCVNFLRINATNMITYANSGHPGVCLGGAPLVFAIYKAAKLNPKDPKWFNRDRIVFSAGHASALVYSSLHMFGYDVSMNDLKAFRQLNSKTPGHPEIETPGVDSSTGPLGQGVANAVGIALAEQHLAAIHNKFGRKIHNHYTYCFLGDGCLMEGVAMEAISLAGNLKLNKLIMLYDYNSVTIEGKLSITNTEDTAAKFKATGWNVINVEDGTSVDALGIAIEKAKKSTKPTIIIAKTRIGYGSSLEDSENSHGTPFSQEQIDEIKEKLEYKEPDWIIPQDVAAYVQTLIDEKIKQYKAEKQVYENYKAEYKISDEHGFDINLLSPTSDEENKEYATRDLCHIILNKLDKAMPNYLIGGSADLSSSTKSFIAGGGYIDSNNYGAQNIHFGVREHAMGAICNGLTLHGLGAFCSTFASFENYMTPAIRMSALMHLPVMYIFSHDSIVGTAVEDGPTHQPIEQIATLRAMPNINVFRPCNYAEMQTAFITAIKNKKPTAILTTRHKLALIKSKLNDAMKGGYIISKLEGAKITLVATGSEVGLALKVQQYLKSKNKPINVVSMPCTQSFDEQDEKYKKSILKGKVFTLEASGDNIWYKYATHPDYVIKMNEFGKSGKAENVYEFFGFNVNDIATKIQNFV